MNENFKKLLNFVNPENLKGNLICCSLYIAFFETTKDYIIEQPKSFFSIGFSSESGEIVGPNYKEKVLSLDTKSVLKASLLWFEQNEAITSNDIEIFYDLREYRNLLAHEMLQKLYDGLDANSFAQKFSQLINLRIKIERWWVFNIEIPTGDFEDPQNIKEEDIMTSTEILYNIISDVLSDDEEKANFYYSEFLKHPGTVTQQNKKE